jgi:hypothetical protein
MRYYLTTISFILLVLLGCTSTKPVNKKTDDILVTYRFINFVGQTNYTMESPEFIIKDKDYFFIKKPSIVAYENNDKKPDTSYSYYFFHKDYKYGFYKDFLNEDSNKIINKDSFFLQQFYFNLEKINQKSKDNYAFLNSYKENGLTVNKYYLKKEIDSSYNDTTLFYFDDKLMDVEFSLDRHLDSLQQSKFVKIRALYYNKIRESPNYGKVYREICIAFTPGEFQKKGEFKELVAMFEKYNSMYKLKNYQ